MKKQYCVILLDANNEVKFKHSYFTLFFAKKAFKNLQLLNDGDGKFLSKDGWPIMSLDKRKITQKREEDDSDLKRFFAKNTDY